MEERDSITKNLPIHGFVKNFDESDHLHVYGSDRLAILQLVDKEPRLGEQLDPDYAYLKAEVVWAVREEMARKIEDVLARRIRILFLDARASLRMAPEVASILAEELGWDDVKTSNEIQEFVDLANGYILK